ncbi:MAG: EAL domain-containing protein, partial [Alphaproteobacteria bacterium]
GCVSAIDNMLLFRCVQLVRRTQQRRFEIGFFCHISPHTLSDGAFLADFVAFMTQNRELAANLYFEFTQASVAEQTDDVARQLSRLARVGYRFSLDQVSDLNLDAALLRRQNFAFVKLDAAKLLESRRSGAAVDPRELRERLDRHGINLVAEKIETEEVLLELLDIGIKFGQGYLFGEPRPSRVG